MQYDLIVLFHAAFAVSRDYSQIRTQCRNLFHDSLFHSVISAEICKILYIVGKGGGVYWVTKRRGGGGRG